MYMYSYRYVYVRHYCGSMTLVPLFANVPYQSIHTDRLKISVCCYIHIISVRIHLCHYTEDVANILHASSYMCVCSTDV